MSELIEKLQKKETELNEQIKEAQKEWVEKYHFRPDHKMSCFDVVFLLDKLGLLKGD